MKLKVGWIGDQGCEVGEALMGSKGEVKPSQNETSRRRSRDPTIQTAVIGYLVGHPVGCRFDTRARLEVWDK